MINKSNNPNNPPAFPRLAFVKDDGTIMDGGHMGMSLRDYFAAAVLQGFAANNDFNGDEYTHADLAYTYADAMLERRENDNQHNKETRDHHDHR